MKLPINYEHTHFSVRKLAREQYVRLQDGKCWYCHHDLSGEPDKIVKEKPVNRKLFPLNFFKWPVHLHHDRKTGMTIGAVHNYCNAVLWQHHGE